MAIVETHELTKCYSVVDKAPGAANGWFDALFRRRTKVITALRNLSLTIDEGECVAYLGPNGAGKSTTIKLLCGVLAPTSGRAYVCGVAPVTHRIAVAGQIGVVFGQRSQLLWDLPVQESYRYLAVIYDLPNRVYKSHLDEIVQLFDIGSLLSRPVRELSLGQRVRCEIAGVLLHRPRLLLLDEPTIGLDLMVKDRVRNALLYWRGEYGTTILLASHDLGDVEALSDRAILLNDGALSYDGSLDGLKRLASATQSIEFTFDQGCDELKMGLDDPAIAVRRIGNRVFVSYDPLVHTAIHIIQKVVTMGGVRDIHLREPSLEDALRRLYGHSGNSEQIRGLDL